MLSNHDTAARGRKRRRSRQGSQPRPQASRGHVTSSPPPCRRAARCAAPHPSCGTTHVPRPRPGGVPCQGTAPRKPVKQYQSVAGTIRPWPANSHPPAWTTITPRTSPSDSNATAARSSLFTEATDASLGKRNTSPSATPGESSPCWQTPCCRSQAQPGGPEPTEKPHDRACPEDLRPLQDQPGAQPVSDSAPPNGAEILTHQQPHHAVTRTCSCPTTFAAYASTARISSRSNPYSSSISSKVIPQDNLPSTRSTGTRIPRTTGLPNRTPGSTVIRGAISTTMLCPPRCPHITLPDPRRQRKLTSAAARSQPMPRHRPSAGTRRWQLHKRGTTRQVPKARPTSCSNPYPPEIPCVTRSPASPPRLPARARHMRTGTRPQNHGLSPSLRTCTRRGRGTAGARGPGTRWIRQNDPCTRRNTSTTAANPSAPASTAARRRPGRAAPTGRGTASDATPSRHAPRTNYGRLLVLVPRRVVTHERLQPPPVHPSRIPHRPRHLPVVGVDYRRLAAQHLSYALGQAPGCSGPMIT